MGFEHRLSLEVQHTTNASDKNKKSPDPSGLFWVGASGLEPGSPCSPPRHPLRTGIRCADRRDTRACPGFPYLRAAADRWSEPPRVEKGLLWRPFPVWLARVVSNQVRLAHRRGIRCARESAARTAGTRGRAPAFPTCARLPIGGPSPLAWRRASCGGPFLFGWREWSRTTDPYRVKVGIGEYKSKNVGLADR